MNHYVYRLTCQEGFFYVGLRSCAGPPENDDYQGSGNRLKAAREMGMVFEKEILDTFDTREEAATYEAGMIATHNPWSLNMHCNPHMTPVKRGAKRGTYKPRTKPNKNKGKPWSAARRAAAGNEGRPKGRDRFDQGKK